MYVLCQSCIRHIYADAEGDTTGAHYPCALLCAKRGHTTRLQSCQNFPAFQVHCVHTLARGRAHAQGKRAGDCKGRVPVKYLTRRGRATEVGGGGCLQGGQGNRPEEAEAHLPGGRRLLSSRQRCGSAGCGAGGCGPAVLAPSLPGSRGCPGSRRQPCGSRQSRGECSHGHAPTPQGDPAPGPGQ